MNRVMIEREWLQELSKLDDERRLSVFAICLRIALPEHGDQVIDGFSDPVLNEVLKKTVIRSATENTPALIALREERI